MDRWPRKSVLGSGGLMAQPPGRKTGPYHRRSAASTGMDSARGRLMPCFQCDSSSSAVLRPPSTLDIAGRIRDKEEA
jgi:hypothetical protein